MLGGSPRSGARLFGKFIVKVVGSVSGLLLPKS